MKLIIVFLFFSSPAYALNVVIGAKQCISFAGRLISPSISRPQDLRVFILDYNSYALLKGRDQFGRTQVIGHINYNVGKDDLEIENSKINDGYQNQGLFQLMVSAIFSRNPQIKMMSGVLVGTNADAFYEHFIPKLNVYFPKIRCRRTAMNEFTYKKCFQKSVEHQFSSDKGRIKILMMAKESLKNTPFYKVSAKMGIKKIDSFSFEPQNPVGYLRTIK